MNPTEQIWSEYNRVLAPLIHYALRNIARAGMEEVLDEWSKPHRVYHSPTHLAEALTELAKWESAMSDRDYLTAFVALLLHDIEYHIPPKELSNEVLSSQWSMWFIFKCGIRHLVNVEEVEKIILVTEGHQPYDFTSMVVCWCDLAGFAHGDKISRANSDKIRSEYLKFYTAEEYEPGRRAFLTSYRNPFKVYPGAHRWWTMKANRLNRKANRQLDREAAELV